jgi:hypothetical protein
LAGYVRQQDVQDNLRSLSSERDLHFLYVVLADGQIRAVYSGPIDACTHEKVQAMLRSVSALAQAAERIWPVVEHNWAWQRASASGLGFLAAILVGTAILFAALLYSLDFWP